MSHVIPSRLFQVLKSDRWNCNVFSGPKKSEGTQITCDFWEDEVGARLRIDGWDLVAGVHEVVTPKCRT